MKHIVSISLIVSVLAFAFGPAMPAFAAPAELGYGTWHSVRPGETLFSIGRLYRVLPWAISAANHLPNPNRIHVGQWLYIPAGLGYPPYGCQYYTVRMGDTLHGIGRRYGLSPWAIASANGIYNLNAIYVGQRLLIPCH